MRVFGGSISDGAESSLGEAVADAYILEEGEDTFVVRSDAGWIVVLEFNRFRGGSSKRLASLSEDGVAFSVGWTVELDAFIKHYAQGRPVVTTDPILLGVEPSDDEGLAWSEGYGLTASNWRENWRAAVFAIAESIT